MSKILKLSLIGVSALTMVGCKKFVDVNNNPNTPTTATAQNVFSGAEGTTYRNQISTNLLIIPGGWAGFYGHSTSYTTGGAEKTYNYSNTDFNAFDALFDNLGDYQFVKDNAARDGVSFLVNPAEVMQCYVTQQLVDLYGDIPYSQALKGQSNLTPAYDNQKTIYESLIVRLDTALNRMNRETWPTATNLTNQDIMFQGNRDNWMRFANTLKLRILLRQAYVAGRDAYITTNINSTKAYGYLTNTNALIQPGFQTISGKLNPFYSTYGYNELNVVQTGHQLRKMNQVIMRFLKTSQVAEYPGVANSTTGRPGTATAPTVAADTFRLQALAYPAGTTPTQVSNDLTTYVGIPYGTSATFTTATTSPIGPLLIQQGQGTRPGLFMLSAEAYLLMAEAKERYPAIDFTTYGSPSTDALYNAGVRSHFATCAGYITGSYTGAISAAADAAAIRYLTRVTIPGSTNNYINITLTPNKLRSINIQKWVSFVHVNGLEAWSDYRRTNGTPEYSLPFNPFSYAAAATTEGVRYLYPAGEASVNPNVPTGITKSTKLFWDVN